MFLRKALLAAGLCAMALAAAAAAKRPAKARVVARASKSSLIAQRWLRTLSLHDEIAQLVIMPCYGEAMNVRSPQYREYERLVREVRIGGLIVIGHSQYGAIHNAEPYALAELLNRLQKAARIPLLVAADFERGASMRVNFTTAWPYNMAFAAAGDVGASRLEGAAAARDARALGVNWLFAPDADVNNNPDNPIINIRSYGEDPRQVAAHVEAFIAGAHSDPKHPVLVTAKHFPGHGDTAEDSHLGLARLNADKDRIETVELAPFRAAIWQHVDAVMTAHIEAPALEPQDIPATVSAKIITGVLRDELHFHGLVVTDAMDMQGLMQMFDTGEAAARAIEAGADVLLMPEKAEDAIAGVLRAVKSGRIGKRRLDQSALRVLEAKARLGLSRSRMVRPGAIGEIVDSPEDDNAAQRVADRAVTLVKNDKDLLPLRNPGSAALLILAENRNGQQGRRLLDEVKKRAPGMRAMLLDPGMPKDDLDRAAQGTGGASCVVVAAYVTVAAYRGNLALAGEYTSLMNTLLNGKAPVILASLGNPYIVRSFPGVQAYLTTYGPTATSEIALAKALFGEIPIAGHLPVTIPGIAKLGSGLELPAATTAVTPPVTPLVTRARKGP